MIIVSFLLLLQLVLCQIKVKSFEIINNDTLTVSVLVKNIAYEKIVTANYCDTKTCLKSFPCSYKQSIENQQEIWVCTNSNFPDGLVSFTMKYQVSGSTYLDLGPNNNGYKVTLAPAAPIPNIPAPNPPSPVGPNDAFLYFSVGGIPVPGSSRLAIQTSLSQFSSITLQSNSNNIWTGSAILPNSLNYQFQWNLVLQSGDLIKPACGGMISLTALPSTVIYINQGASNDNVFQGVRYINIDQISIC